MAHRLYSISKNELDNRRFTDNLQRHSKILFKANKELKKATRAKSEFVSKMSHEFRAALNVIIGFTELMLDEVPGPINQQQKHSLNDILASSQRLLALVNEYLEEPELERQKVIQTTLKSN
jgi:signal transduction histidine kinase